jgi:hypothetical protein
LSQARVRVSHRFFNESPLRRRSAHLAGLFDIPDD